MREDLNCVKILICIWLAAVLCFELRHDSVRMHAAIRTDTRIIPKRKYDLLSMHLDLQTFGIKFIGTLVNSLKKP